MYCYAAESSVFDTTLSRVRCRRQARFSRMQAYIGLPLARRQTAARIHACHPWHPFAVIMFAGL
jgi:hypothetical protein